MTTVVVDYGMGNVFSVCNALRKIGADVELTGELASIRSADRLVLPGVGAFARCMEAMRERGLVDALRDYAATGRPFLGICVGMQMLMDRSFEFGEQSGLGLIPGTVERIAGNERVPHIGWATLRADGEWHGTPLVGTDGAVYFVHSFHCVPVNEADRLAHVEYGGARITAAIRRGNLFGVQFHPERSGNVGQGILRSFVGGHLVNPLDNSLEQSELLRLKSQSTQRD